MGWSMLVVKALDLLASRQAILVIMGLMGLFALGGAVLPEAAATALYWSGIFRVMTALFLGSLVVSLIRRFRVVGSRRKLGSWLMHFSLVLITAGAIYNVIYSREGLVEVIEGQGVGLPEGGCRLDLVRLFPFSREGNKLKGESAMVWLYCPGVMEGYQTLYVNHAIKVGGMQVRLLKHGFAPFLGFSSNADGIRVEAFTSLLTEFGPQVWYWADFGPPKFPESFSVVFHPSETGPFLRSPSLHMVFRSDRRAVFLMPGKTISHGGYTYQLGGVRYWAQFRVSKDPGLGLVFTGFWVAIAGASVALLPRVLHAVA